MPLRRYVLPRRSSPAGVLLILCSAGAWLPVTTTNFHRDGVLRSAILELCFDGARAGDRWATAGFPRARPGGAKEARIGKSPT